MKDYTATGLKILTAAKVLFAEQGYNAVSTKLIAKEAQVNEVTLFRTFETKENLFEKVIEYFIFKPHFKNIQFDGFESLDDLLLALGNFLHVFFTENLNLILMELRSPESMKRRQRIAKFPKEIRNKLAEQFEKRKGLNKADAQLDAICFMTALHGICFNLYVLKIITKDVSYQECLENIVRKYS